MSERFLSPDGCFQLTHSSKEEIRSAFKQLSGEIDSAIARLKAIETPTWDNLIVPYSEADVLVAHFASRLITIYVYSISNDDYQEVYGEIFSDFSELEAKLSSSTEIAEKVLSLKDSAEYQSFDQEQKNYILSILRSAKNQGTLTNAETKQSISEINKEISKWSEIFNSNLNKATKAGGVVVKDRKDLGDLPQQWVVRASEHFNAHFEKNESTPETGPWFISFTSGVEMPFLEYSGNRELKKEIYTQKRKLASEGESDNTEAIQNLLRTRKELAKLRGFDNFLENALEFNSATANQLDVLCKSLSAPFKKTQERLHDKYRDLAAKDGIQNLEPWDLALYGRLYKEANGFNKEEISEYFPYQETKNEIFKLFEECFSIRIVNATQEVGSWNADVEFYKMFDSDGTELGGFYIDPYQRAGEKIVGTQNIGAFYATLREPSFVNGKNIGPIGLMSFGMPSPTEEVPSLFDIEELSGFFHEFGHLLAIFLKKKSTKTISPSFRLQDDSIEFESMVLEYWGQVPYILKRISKHYKTGDSLSDSQIEMLRDFLRKENDERAHGLLWLTRLSLAMYSTFDPAKDDLQAVLNEITKDTVASPYFEGDRRIWGAKPVFTLNGYLANCYMYLWAMTVAHTYLAEIESVGWNDESIKKLGKTLKNTLYRHTAVGQPMEALKMATGKDVPDFQGFALSKISK
ncbi:M3 family metallopeptidase [Bdellovibrio sp. HCB290]|uniref:M3 family metallopeptidase n=1 Tax=Bdellovibrio sp. HCB290 TaxID=3394356 RepID=UPI0039B44CDB